MNDLQGDHKNDPKTGTHTSDGTGNFTDTSNGNFQIKNIEETDPTGRRHDDGP